MPFAVLKKLFIIFVSRSFSKKGLRFQPMWKTGNTLTQHQWPFYGEVAEKNKSIFIIAKLFKITPLIELLEKNTNTKGKDKTTMFFNKF